MARGVSLLLLGVLAVGMLCGGCATSTPAQTAAHGAPADAALAANAPSASPSASAAAVIPANWDGKSSIQQTNFLTDAGDSVKSGWNKVTSVLTPDPQEKPVDPAVSVFATSKASPETYIIYGKMHEQRGQVADAENAYQQALNVAPKHLGAMLAYGDFKDRQGEMPEAIRCYQKAAKAYPRDPVPHNHMGLCYVHRQMYKEAIEAYQRAIALQPNRPLFRNNMAAALVLNQQPDAALANLRAVYGEPEALYKLGYLVADTGGDRRLAAKCFTKALEKNPKMAEAREWLAKLETPEYPDRPPVMTAAVAPSRPTMIAMRPAAPPMTQTAPAAPSGPSAMNGMPIGFANNDAMLPPRDRLPAIAPTDGPRVNPVRQLPPANSSVNRAPEANGEPPLPPGFDNPPAGRMSAPEALMDQNASAREESRLPSFGEAASGVRRLPAGDQPSPQSKVRPIPPIAPEPLP